jgi:hypothetical protein
MGVSSAIAWKVGIKIADEGFDQLSVHLADVTRSAVDMIVSHRGGAIAAETDVFRLQHPGADVDAVARALVRDKSRKGAAAGVISGLPSVVIGPGTTLEVAVALADGAALTYHQITIALQLAYLRGFDITSVEARRLDVLLILGLDTGVVKRNGARLVFDGGEIDPAALSDDFVGRVAREMADRIVSKIARRRARALLGRLLPYGVGVAVAGMEDYRGIGSVGRSARTYFDLRGVPDR